MINNEENLLSFYDQDIKDYLNLDEDIKEIIKNFALHSNEDVIQVKESKSKFFDKIQEYYMGKFAVEDYEPFIIPNMVGLLNLRLRGGFRFTIEEYFIRIINIRIYLTIKPEQEALNKIFNSKENKKRSRL